MASDMELLDNRAGAPNNTPRTTTNLRLKNQGNNSMLKESGKYPRPPMGMVLQVLHNMAKPKLAKTQTPGNQLAFGGYTV